MIIESGIHPCVDSINFAYLAFQGHCRRVTHSFRNVSPWTSLFLALSGDISLNPGPGSRSLNGCLLNVRSIRNKSASFLEFVKDNNADLIAVTHGLGQRILKVLSLVSHLLVISSLRYLEMSRKGAELAFSSRRT